MKANIVRTLYLTFLVSITLFFLCQVIMGGKVLAKGDRHYLIEFNGNEREVSEYIDYALGALLIIGISSMLILGVFYAIESFSKDEKDFKKQFDEYINSNKTYKMLCKIFGYGAVASFVLMFIRSVLKI